MERVRIDKWLWAARFFKTRSLATEAVAGGRVHVNDTRVKPSREVAPGDRVEVTFAAGRRMTVIVKAVADRRGPASEAQALYEETPESIEERERRSAERRVARPPGAGLPGRPTKRDRRRLDALRRGLRR